MVVLRTSHVVYDTKYHLVWPPKYRRWIVREDIRRRVVYDGGTKIKDWSKGKGDKFIFWIMAAILLCHFPYCLTHSAEPPASGDSVGV